MGENICRWCNIHIMCIFAICVSLVSEMVETVSLMLVCIVMLPLLLSRGGSVCHPLSQGWLCDFLWPTACHGNDARCKRLAGFFPSLRWLSWDFHAVKSGVNVPTGERLSSARLPATLPAGCSHMVTPVKPAEGQPHQATESKRNHKSLFDVTKV